MKFSLPTLLFAIFLTLKLTDQVDWSWFWVCSPLLIGYSLVVLFMVVFAALFLISGPRD